MPCRCIAFGCRNCPSETVTLHGFPTNKKTLRQWINFIKRKREGWSYTGYGYLCSWHFTEDSFQNLGMFREKMCKRLILTENAVPTIHAPTDGWDDKGKVGDKEIAMPASIRKRHVNAILKEVSGCF